MPPELLRILGIQLPLLRRDPWYFLPTTGAPCPARWPLPRAGRGRDACPARAGERYLLFGSDSTALRQQFAKFFSEEDWRADQRLQVRQICACRRRRPMRLPRAGQPA
jgi:hypothetical protein